MKAGADPNSIFRIEPWRADYLLFLSEVTRRIDLTPADKGPRAVVVVGNMAYVANYFSDTLSIVNLDDTKIPVKSIPLGSPGEATQVRKGEFFFNDAGICRDGWQTCSSCHPGGGRADSLNWDLLNDGRGNRKNTKSLLLSHRTPPAMSLGVRTNAEAAVRAGIQHILFTQPSEDVASAIDAYLRSLKPMASPHLKDGQLSSSAVRGKAVFARAGCAECHSGDLFSDLGSYDVGTQNALDKPTDEFDTPSLIELWRTAPYLHDGSAATVRDVLLSRNPRDQHGSTSKLTSAELDDLGAYLLSL
jgi:cytochrome c peroxidase